MRIGDMPEEEALRYRINCLLDRMQCIADGPSNEWASGFADAAIQFDAAEQIRWALDRARVLAMLPPDEELSIESQDDWDGMIVAVFDFGESHEDQAEE